MSLLQGGATDLETLILKAGGKIHPDGGRGVRVYMDGIFDMSAAYLISIAASTDLDPLRCIHGDGSRRAFVVF